MEVKTKARLLVVPALCLAWLSGAAGAAQVQYPTKPIRLIVPFPPGGTTDVVARVIAQKLTENWSQQVVVDNRPGAGGIIGTELAAKAPADGYTLLLGSITTHAVNPSLYKKLPFDPLRDFAPVSLAVSTPQVLVVHPSVAAKSVKELIALAKAKPGQLNYASAGTGTSPHLTFELFKSMAGVNLVHVPYKGTGPAITDLIGGQVQTMITGVVALYPHIKAGKLRALGATSAKRVAALPDVPTIAESGVPGFDVASWFGVFAPAGTPKPVVTRLNAEIVKILAVPELRRKLAAQGADPATNTPEQFAAYVKSELARWGKVVQATGARVD
ncbi:MAG: tripartite tricarboxylate transporter substrate binding protein [Betaproteobacteria bacterium]|nr:tripartite tricarboxylate transporter substrate binding protein [Betaproteobacteria bacterium]